MDEAVTLELETCWLKSLWPVTLVYIPKVFMRVLVTFL